MLDKFWFSFYTVYNKERAPTLLRFTANEGGGVDKKGVTIMKKWITMFFAFLLLLSTTSVAFGETVTFGRYGYDPITWVVLSSDESYTRLLSEYVIACMPFDSRSSDWSTSDVRSWLNDSFFYNAFNREERAAVCSLNNDMVRLPGLGDMTSYGFAASRDAQDRGRAAMGNGYAVSDGLWVNRGNYCSYYTLTPNDSETLFQVRTDGSIGIARCDRDNVGVRPMVIVRTEALR